MARTDITIIKDKETQRLIKDHGLELLCEISSDEKNFEKKINEVILGVRTGYLVVVKDYAGPEDDIRYQVYTKHI